VRIGVIAGDGIGPELVESAVTVLRAVAALGGPQLEYVDEAGGAATYMQTGEALTPGAIERFRDEYAAVLKGPVGLPDVRRPDGTEAGLLGGLMRLGLDTFANVRPIRLLPGVQAPTRHQPGAIDYVIVRENTEGLYLSRGVGVVNARAACDQLMMTREGVERVVRFSFDLARTRQGAPADAVRRVTCVDKSNVLRSFAFFRSIFEEVAAEYPDIEADYRYPDAAAHDLVVDPARFDVLVMENFLGDILSDLGAGTVGGLGMCPSANIGHRSAYFEPIHGSAPSLAGKDQANPTSQILSAAMLLDHIGAPESATRVRDAVAAAYADGAVVLTPDGRPKRGTRAVTDAIVQRLSSVP
jgi:isocitrate/isopropylmalate dehydrogenase